MNLTDDQWLLIQSLLPPSTPRETNRGRPPCSERSILDAILWVRRTGSPWCELPLGYPSYLTCRRRSLAWTRSGLMDRILSVLRDDLARRGGLELSDLKQSGLITATRSTKSLHLTIHPDLAGTWQLSTAMIYIVPLLKKNARRRRLRLVFKMDETP